MSYTALIRSVAPATTPVSTAEAKAQCRVDSDDEDTYFDGLVLTATAYAEESLGRGLITQTWQQWSAPNPDAVRLDVGNFASLSGVSYYDTDGALQVSDLANYETRLGRDRVTVWAKQGISWPTTQPRDDAIRITYTVGGTAADVAPDIKHAILMLVSHWHENREAATEVKLTDTPMAVDALLGLHKVGWYG